MKTVLKAQVMASLLLFQKKKNHSLFDLYWTYQYVNKYSLQKRMES